MNESIEKLAEAVEAMEATSKKGKSWEERNLEREKREIEHHENYQAELKSAGFHRQLASELWQREVESVTAHRGRTEALNERDIAARERDIESAIQHRQTQETHQGFMRAIAEREALAQERQAAALERIAESLERPVKILASSMEEKP